MMNLAKLCDLLVDGPAFPWNARHVKGFPRKYLFVEAEEANERAFLFGGKRGANMHHFALRAARVYEDLLGALH